MADKTGIQWVQGDDGSPGATWNPVRGCSRTSPGCENCYAEHMAGRILLMDRSATRKGGGGYEGLVRIGKNGARWTGKIRLVPEQLDQPMRWRRPRRIFVNSMSDLFHEDLPDEDIARVFVVMALAKHHTFLILTKRAERMREWMSDGERRLCILKSENKQDDWIAVNTLKGFSWPLPNVHMGVSVEDQPRAEERIPHLLRTPAVVRWISAEPLIGPVDLTPWLPPHGPCVPGRPDQPLLSWCVAGGESGHDARPFDIAWARSLREQCKAAGTAYFLKQLGSRPVGDWHGPGSPPLPSILGDLRDAPFRANGIWRLKHTKGGDIEEFPADLRVRQMPEVV